MRIENATFELIRQAGEFCVNATIVVNLLGMLGEKIVCVAALFFAFLDYLDPHLFLFDYLFVLITLIDYNITHHSCPA